MYIYPPAPRERGHQAAKNFSSESSVRSFQSSSLLRYQSSSPPVLLSAGLLSCKPQSARLLVCWSRAHGSAFYNSRTMSASHLGPQVSSWASPQTPGSPKW